MNRYEVTLEDGSTNVIVADLAFVEANFETWVDLGPIIPEKTPEQSAREWRNEELARTDQFVQNPDFPLILNYQVYRQELRDWPESESFPDTRPVLNEEFLPIITRRAFIQRFEDVEYASLEIASIDNPEGTVEERMQQAVLRKKLKELDNSQYIDLRDIAISNALDLMISLGFLTQERKDEILNTPVAQIEKYKGIL